MRYTVCIAVLYFLVWLDISTAIPKCLGGDEAPSDLVLLKSFTAPIPVHKVGFSKNGQLLAGLCNAPGFPNWGDVILWDIKSGKFLRRIRPLSEWKGVILRPDGPIEFPYYFTTVPYARLCYRTATGLEVQDDLAICAKRPIRLKRLDGSAKIEMGGVYFSMDDKYVAAVRKDDRSVNVWDVQSGDRLCRLALPDVSTAEVRSVVFDATNRYVAAGWDSARASGRGAAIVWDVETGQEVLHTDEEFRVFQVAFCANGDLICAGGDRVLESGTVTVRTAGEFDEARTIHTPCGVCSIAIVPHVGLITGDWHGQVLLWDIETSKLLAVAKENGQEVVSLAVGQNGKLIASGDWDSVARLWKLAGLHAPK